MNEIINEFAALSFHDACHVCGKRSDGLTTCTYPVDDLVTKLCPTCIEDSGHCYGCGRYCSGLQSFDFSPIPNYCTECIIELDLLNPNSEPYDPPISFVHL